MTPAQLAVKIIHECPKEGPKAQVFIESLLQTALEEELQKRTSIITEERYKKAKAAGYADGFSMGKMENCCKCNSELFNVRQAAYLDAAKIAEEWDADCGCQDIAKEIRCRASELK